MKTENITESLFKPEIYTECLWIKLYGALLVACERKRISGCRLSPPTAGNTSVSAGYTDGVAAHFFTICLN